MQDLTTNIGMVDATRHVDAVKRRWLMIVFITVVCMLCVGIATFFMPKTYASTTSVLVAPVAGSMNAALANGRTSGEINLDTEAQIVRSVALAEHVAQLTGTDRSAREIASAVSVSVPANSQVLTITYEDATARSARAGAEGYASAYLSDRRAQSEATIQEAQTGMQSELETLRAELATQTARSQDEDLTDVDRAIASNQRDGLVSQITSLSSTLAALTRTPVRPGEVLSAANLPSSPVSPSPVVNLAVGLVAGLLLGLVVAVALGHSDRRIRQPHEIRSARGGRVLVFDNLLTRVAGMDRLDAEYADEIDQLRIAVDFSSKQDPRTVLVAPVGTNADAEWVGLALAQAYARQLGSTVFAAIDPAATSPRVLGVDGPGLTDLLHGRDLAPLEVDPSGVAAIGPGNDPEELSGLLQQPHSLDRIVSLTQTNLIAVVPSLQDSAGAQSMLRRVDRVVLVGVSGVLDERELDEALEAADRADFRGSMTIALIGRTSRKRIDRPADVSPHQRRSGQGTDTHLPLRAQQPDEAALGSPAGT